MTGDQWTVLIISALCIPLSYLLRGVIAQCASGAWGPNAYIGMRTSATRASPQAWKVGHAAAVKLVTAGAHATAILAVVTMIAAIVTNSMSVLTPLLLAVFVVMVAGIIAGGIAAHQAAKKTPLSV